VAKNPGTVPKKLPEHFSRAVLAEPWKELGFRLTRVPVLRAVERELLPSRGSPIEGLRYAHSGAVEEIVRSHCTAA